MIGADKMSQIVHHATEALYSSQETSINRAVRGAIEECTSCDKVTVQQMDQITARTQTAIRAIRGS